MHAFTLLRPLIHLLPPETVHQLGLWALSRGMIPARRARHFPSLEVKAFGLKFPSPIGLAAGFDKNAVAYNELLMQGFGFVEVGTVTPQPQPGNPSPRIFRLSEDEAVINRLGFNNNGLIPFVGNIRSRDKSKGVVGANIGKNKDSEDAIADYVSGLRAVYAYANYITVNISSPNTQGLRALQGRESLAQLLAALQETRAQCVELYGYKVPLLVKVAPDLTPREKQDIAEVVIEHKVDGLIVSNTTISRPADLINRHMGEQGGLSGKPLFMLSTETLKDFYRLTQGKMPLIGVGGVSSAHEAYLKIRAGATLVQLYTALVYQGFGVVREIQEGLAALLERDGFDRVQQAVGIDVRLTQ